MIGLQYGEETHHFRIAFLLRDIVSILRFSHNGCQSSFLPKQMRLQMRMKGIGFLFWLGGVAWRGVAMLPH